MIRTHASGRTQLGNGRQINQNVLFHSVCRRQSKPANKSKSDDKETVTHAGVHHHGGEDRRGREVHKTVWPRREGEVGLNTGGGELRQLGETHEDN